LESRRRNKGESVASFGDDLRQLAQKAYSDLDTRAQERLALNQFYKSLTADMKCRCVDNNCTAVNDAVNVVERYESILGVQNIAPVRALDVSAPQKAETEELKAMIKKLEAKLEKIERSCNSSTQQPKNDKLCFGCNSSGHLWRNCPQNTNSRGNNGQRGRQNAHQNSSDGTMQNGSQQHSSNTSAPQQPIIPHVMHQGNFA
jgi:hypothetical protein